MYRGVLYGGLMYRGVLYSGLKYGGLMYCEVLYGGLMYRGLVGRDLYRLRYRTNHARGLQSRGTGIAVESLEFVRIFTDRNSPQRGSMTTTAFLRFDRG